MNDAGELVPLKEYIYLQSKKLGINKAMVEYMEEDPTEAVGNFSTIYGNLTKYYRLKNKVDGVKSNLADVDLKHFRIFNNSQLKWWLKEGNKQCTLILIGKSGCGKTQLAKALCNYINSTSVDPSSVAYLLISDISGLKNYRDQKSIIYDDPYFKAENAARLVSFYDVYDDRDIRILYDVARKSKGLVQIATANTLEQVLPTLEDQVLRRVFIILVPERILPQEINIHNTININFNNCTLNFNGVENPSEKIKELISEVQLSFDEDQLINYNRKLIDTMRNCGWS